MPRLSIWDDTLLNFSVASGAQSAAIVLTLTPGGDSEGFTMVRCIVRLSLFHSSVPANDGYQHLDLAVGLGSKESVAAGIVPDPNTNTEKPVHDWVWRDRCAVPQDAATTLRPIHCKGDFRGQRKLGGGQLYLIVNNSPGHGTAFTVTVNGLIRCLLLRP